MIFSNSFFVLWKEEKKCFEQSKDRLAILYNESLQKVKHFLRTPKEGFLARLMTSGKKVKNVSANLRLRWVCLILNYSETQQHCLKTIAVLAHGGRPGSTSIGSQANLCLMCMQSLSLFFSPTCTRPKAKFRKSFYLFKQILS